MKRACVVLAWLMPVTALAMEYPDIGFVQDEKKHYFIKVECDPPNEQGMNCKFSEVVVYKNGGPEKLAKALEEAAKANPADFSSDKQMASMCANMKGMVDALRSGAKAAPPGMTPESFNHFQSKPAPARSDTLKMFESMEKMCASPTKENLENMTRVQNERESRTCELHLSQWEQNFMKQSDSLWLHNSEPEGICGVINIATLEKDGDNWNYRTHSVVTNKNAVKDNDLFTCKKIDETEHVYKWNAEESLDGNYMGCDYIKYP